MDSTDPSVIEKPLITETYRKIYRNSVNWCNNKLYLSFSTQECVFICQYGVVALLWCIVCCKIVQYSHYFTRLSICCRFSCFHFCFFVKTCFRR